MDAEADGKPTRFSTGDDNDRDGIDDEDGVDMRMRLVNPLDLSGWFLSGRVVASAAGFLTVTADKNLSGHFEDGEMLTTDVLTQQPGATAVSPGANRFDFYLNLTASSLEKIKSTVRLMFVRFRFSTDKAALLLPRAPDGEIEDHAYPMAHCH